MSVSSVAELNEHLAGIDGPALFRGQTKHFGGTDSPAVISSFDRLGCVPHEMIRWAYYATGALKYVLGEAIDSLELEQAVLQHYGWRSFFLDASASAQVGAWFAAHTYKGNIEGHLSEDCFEQPMLLRKPRARYELEPGFGHLYIIDVDATVAAGVGIHDLSAIKIEGQRPRFEAQSAWLLGPHHGNLPIECFRSRVVAKHEVFASFAAEAGFAKTSNLFPGPNEDPVLQSLLHLPWSEMQGDPDHEFLPIFKRTIEVPEYDDGFVKIYGPGNAFYRGEMLADKHGKDAPEWPFVFRKVPEIVMLGVANPVGKAFPHLTKALEADPSIAFEIPQLIRFAETGPTATYGKGLAVQRKAQSLVEVSDLVVDHPGMLIAGGGVNAGWHYTIAESGEWVRTPHPDDCPCGDDDRHRRHLSALTILEHWLTAPEEFTDA